MKDILIKKIIPCLFLILFIVLIAIVILLIRDKNSIKYTEFRKDIFKVAESEVDLSKLEIETRDTDPSGKMEASIIYTVKDDTLSAKEYDDLLKTEVTKVYNSIKNKKIINNTGFDKDKIDPLEITFSLCMKDGSQYKVWLGTLSIDYTDEDGWDASYQKEMKKDVVTEDNLEKALATRGNYLTRR